MYMHEDILFLQFTIECRLSCEHDQFPKLGDDEFLNIIFNILNQEYEIFRKPIGNIDFPVEIINTQVLLSHLYLDNKITMLR